MRRILISATMALLSWAQLSTAAPTKWHPGHYYELEVNEKKNDPLYLKDVYAEMAKTPALRGIVVKYDWSELEPTKDQYDFSQIAKRLTEVTNRKKRLIIMVMTKGFTPGDGSLPNHDFAPNYIKTPYFEGGVYAYGPNATTLKGYNIKLWHSGIRYRLVKLVQALGARFNGHPNFEGIGFNETTTAVGYQTPVTQEQLEAYFANLEIVNERARDAFPNTMVFQFSNYPRWALVSLVNSLVLKGSALGCPDIFLDDPGLNAIPSAPDDPVVTNAGVYLYFRELYEKIPRVVQVERANYENSRFDETGFVPTINELLTYGRDNLKVNYIFWTRIPKYNEALLNELNLPAQKANPQGGLRANCPLTYTSCVQ